MKLHTKQFLDAEEKYSRFETAATVILPFPYEGGVSYGRGTGRAPDAILDASAVVEFYDEVLKAEPFRMGIATLAPPQMPDDATSVQTLIHQQIRSVLQQDKFIVVLGGDHSISSGTFKALREKYPTLACIQLDAHADLRHEYEGSKWSHACVMARIREMTSHTLQLGIRALSLEEAQWAERDRLPLCTMHEFRQGGFDIDRALDELAEPVFITVDADAFDLSVIQSTGTPEPGGFTWDEGLELLRRIFMKKNVVGFDLVELSYAPHDRNSAFSAARLIYKMLGFKLASEIARGHCAWPEMPAGKVWP